MKKIPPSSLVHCTSCEDDEVMKWMMVGREREEREEITYNLVVKKGKEEREKLVNWLILEWIVWMKISHPFDGGLDWELVEMGGMRKGSMVEKKAGDLVEKRWR
jgi:hypothetical protein